MRVRAFDCWYHELDLRDALEADLKTQGKLDWAREEFDHLLTFEGPAPRVDPWRRTSGLHKLRGRRSAAVVRELWYARDASPATRARRSTRSSPRTPARPVRSPAIPRRA